MSRPIQTMTTSCAFMCGVPQGPVFYSINTNTHIENTQLFLDEMQYARKVKVTYQSSDFLKVVFKVFVFSLVFFYSGIITALFIG